jgi:hypothetical protein
MAGCTDLLKNKPGFWNSFDNRNVFMQSLGRKLEYKVPEDWFNLTYKKLVTNGGRGIVRFYNSMHLAITSHVQELKNKMEWEFKEVRHGFWANKENRIKYMLWLANRLNWHNSEDWYKINQKIFYDNNGSGILQFFNSSPISVVKDFITDYDFKEWLFTITSSGFWHKRENRLSYLKWLEIELGYNSCEDWYDVMLEDFLNNKGHAFIGHYNRRPILALVDLLPEYNWDTLRMKKNKIKAKQKRIYRIIKSMYSDAIWEYRSDNIRFKKSGRKMEFDIFIPSLNVAIEYQGLQHFMPMSNWGGESAFSSIQKRDKEKRQVCLEKEIKLIEITCKDKNYTTNEIADIIHKAIDRFEEEKFLVRTF